MKTQREPLLMTLSQGDRLGRYEIVGPIGAGGMGEVWRAVDTELDREVAVKVLPESFASDETRLERFQREAKALAALSHPNLLDIYDVGTTDGIHYAVTELLEGDTLRERITPNGLPWKKVTSIGAAVADGLAAAHGRGIIHRDLKPENLFITADGRVKILDFGLASVHEEADADAETATITEAGTVMGTPGYMAPEQVKGKQADARSDIFSLGCVIYEMASGHRAFGGDTGVEVLAAILKEEPPQLSSSGASVPVDLERAVHRCLEKRPEARFQSAADLAYSLESIGRSSGHAVPVMATPVPTTATSVSGRNRSWWWLGVTAALVILAAMTGWQGITRFFEAQPATPRVEIVPNRIAVVPFENRTGDPTLDPIGAMVADRIAQGLAEIEPPRAVGFDTGADMVPANRIRELLAGDSSTTPAAIAEVTGARIVVTGSCFASGDTIEFDATVTDTARHEVVHVFKPVTAPRDAPGEAAAILRDRAYMVVTDHLSPVLGTFADKRFVKVDAYKLMISALQHINAGRMDLGAALGLRALETDPDFNRVRIWYLMRYGTEERVRPIIEELRKRSDQLTENQLLFIQAEEASLEGKGETSYRVMRMLTDRAPDNTMLAWFTMGNAVATNRPGVAVELFERFESTLEPRANPTTTGMLGVGAEAFHLLGRYDDELAASRRWRSIEQDRLNSRYGEARALAALGRFDELETLVTEARSFQRAGVSAGDFMIYVSRCLRAHGQIERSREMADRAVQWFETTPLEEAGTELCDQCRALALLMGERFEEARAIYENLAASSPDNRYYAISLGVCAARLGDRATALEVDARVEELGDRPGAHGEAAYNRACLAAQLGDRDQALRFLRDAFAQGFPYGIHVHNDPDLEPLRDHSEFREIVRPKG